MYAVMVAATHWAIRRRRLESLRRLAPPGAAHQRAGAAAARARASSGQAGTLRSAPLWLLGIAIIGGLVLISLVRWLIGAVYEVGALAQAEPRIWLIEIVSWVFRILMVALLVRVIASWLGASPYSKWMRPFVVLTDWILDPLRRVLPPMGPFDLSPMVAYFLLWIAQQAVVRALL